MTNKKCAIYSRVSTDSQTTENQTRELRVYAARMNYQIVAELSDNGISGSKGKKDRPGFLLFLFGQSGHSHSVAVRNGTNRHYHDWLG